MKQHRRPNGRLAPGHYCINCGDAVPATGHERCRNEETRPANARPEWVAKVKAANPIGAKKPHFTYGAYDEYSPWDR